VSRRRHGWHAACDDERVNAEAGMDPHPSSNPAGAPERRAPASDPRRERQLKALRERLSALQTSLLAVREGTRQLTEIEAQRRLTPAETARARALRWEGERLRHELQLLRERFESLGRDAATRGPAGGPAGGRRRRISPVRPPAGSRARAAGAGSPRSRRRPGFAPESWCPGRGR
jgi:hypothetical protein